MQQSYYEHEFGGQPGGFSETASPDDPFGMEREWTMTRGFIELLYCICLLNSAFLYRSGLNQIPYLAGGIVTITGLMCIAIFVLSNEKFPITFWASCIIWVGANISQVIGNGQMPLIANGLNLMFFFVCQQIVVYYICQNAGARKRLLLFMSFLAILLIGIAGEGVGAGKVKRLAVTELGGLLANSNGAAYVCSFLAVALLFWSLRAAKIWRPVLWILAAILTIITIRTLSRTGVLLLVVGAMMLVVSILASRGARVGGFVLLFVAAIAASQLAYTVAGSFELIGDRFRGERKNTQSRTDLYDLRTLSDLVYTTPFGRGPDKAIMSSTGITAHNTFVYIHMSYGAITALPLLIWQIILGVRVARMAIATDFPLDTRLMVVAFYGMIFAEYLTNNTSFLEISALYGTAVIEVFTSPYSRAEIARRADDVNYNPMPISESGYSGPEVFA